MAAEVAARYLENSMTQSYPLVSIAIPTYLHAKYLPICIDGAWFQDYPNIEVVVVNANSPDDTKEVLDQYQEAIGTEKVSFASNYNEESKEVEREYYDRYSTVGRSLKVIHLDEDPGLSETYNEAVKASSGEFVTTIVSDDIAHPNLVSRLLPPLQAGADFSYADIFIVDDAGRVIRKFAFPDYDAKRCLANWYLMGSAKLWRRSLHEKAGWFSPDYPLTQDYELFFRFAEAGAKFVHVPEVLYSARWHGPRRKDGNHSPDREHKIHTESIQTALRAREWLAQQGA